MRSVGPGDDRARFLADLRALRDTAAIGFDELAARTHYPSDLLKEAENGPRLPSLPILAAYVRACDGNVLDWEERWRRLGDETRADPNLPVRPAGASPAAVAGARAGIGVVPPEAYDPERIKAALRGSTEGTRTVEASGISDTATGLGTSDMATDLGTWDGFGGSGTSEPALGTRTSDTLAGTSDPAAGLGTPDPAAGLGIWDRGAGTFDSAAETGTSDGLGGTGTSDWGAGAAEAASGLGTSDGTLGMADGPGVDSSWSTAGDRGIGGHLAEGQAGETAERAWDDQFSAWLRDREPALQAGDENFSWLEPNRQAAQARQTPETSWSPGGSLAPPEPVGGGLAGQPGRTRAGIDLTQGTGSASGAAPRASAAPTAPATAARPVAATGPATGLGSTGLGSTGLGSAADLGSAAGLGSTAGLGSAGLGSAGPTAGKRSAGTGQAATSGIKVTVATQPRRQPSRVFSLRLLLVVIVAALLGSMLVMLLR